MRGWRFIPLVVVAAGLLVYANSFTGSYFHDDFYSIVENPTIRSLWPIGQCLSPPHQNRLVRPLINLTFAISYALSGYSVWSYHLLNLTVHVLAGLTLLGIVRRTLRQPPLRDRFGPVANELALATAVLWTVHPLQTESVTYIFQRTESIMGLFYLLTVYCFIRGVDSPGRRLWYSLSVTACALGMASKEVMVSAPLMVMLYDRAFVSATFREAWRRRWRLYLALLTTWSLLVFIQLAGHNFATALSNAEVIHVTWLEYLATQPGVILYYLRLCAWPYPLMLQHNWPIAKTGMSILLPAVVVLTLLAAVVWGCRRNSAWGFVGAWFFLILAPSSSFIPLVDLVYEHRMYLSLAAVVIVTVIGLYSLMGRNGLVVVAVIAMGMGFLTWRRNQEYHRNPDYTLGMALAKSGAVQGAIEHFEQALRVIPNNPEVHYNLGVALMQAGRNQDAIEHLELALRITPEYAEGHQTLGVVLMELGRLQESADQLERALRLKPEYAEAHYNLGVTLMQMGQTRDAIQHWEQAVRINPGFAEAHNNLGSALLGLGRVPEAIAHWEQALRVKPDYAVVHYNLGVALAQQGQVSAAIAHWEEALRIKPDYAEAHSNLGSVLARSGNMPEAIAHWEQALRIDPGLPETHKNLGVTLLGLGRVPEAVGHLEQAVRLRPDYIDAHYNLGIALEKSGRIEEAIVQYEQVLQLKPGDPAAQDRLAQLRTGR